MHDNDKQETSCVVYQAMVNVPALSERTMRRDIASTDITIGSGVQVIYLYMHVAHSCMQLL